MAKNIQLVKKNKYIAAVLAFAFGGFGVHRFYLGQTGLGILYLIFSITGIPWIIGFIDFIIFLIADEKAFDLKYNPEFVDEEDLSYYSKSSSRETYHSRRKQNILKRLNKHRNNIKKTLRKSDGYTKDFIRDITPLMDKYLLQVEDLLDRDEKLAGILSNNSVQEINDSISELNTKLQAHNDEILQNEYKKAIERHNKRKNSILEFKKQREMIKLRLDEIEMSFEQIQYDLVKVEALTEREQRNEINKIFKERSDDLGHYLEALKSSYKEING